MSPQRALWLEAPAERLFPARTTYGSRAFGAIHRTRLYGWTDEVETMTNPISRRRIDWVAFFRDCRAGLPLASGWRLRLKLDQWKPGERKHG